MLPARCCCCVHAWWATMLAPCRKSWRARRASIPSRSAIPGDWHDSFDITLPPGYVVDETPDPVDVDMDFASYHSSITAKGNVLHYERDYVVRQVEIPPDKAADFRKLENAILFDEKGAAVLKKQ